MAEWIRKVRVTGEVQGVAYRAWTCETARRLDLAGWVRNRDDGSVLTHLEGSRAAVDEMITLMWQGPGAARVQDVQVEEAEGEGCEGFEVRW